MADQSASEGIPRSSEQTKNAPFEGAVMCRNHGCRTDRWQKIFLRTLRAPQDLRPYASNVVIQCAGLVNASEPAGECRTNPSRITSLYEKTVKKLPCFPWDSRVLLVIGSPDRRQIWAWTGFPNGLAPNGHLHLDPFRDLSDGGTRRPRDS